MGLQLTDSQKTTLRIRPVDAAGNDARVDGAPSWSLGGTNPETVTLTPAGDGLTAELVTSGSIGTCQVSVTADADLGEGVATIANTLDVEVIAGPAVSLGLVADTPTER